MKKLLISIFIICCTQLTPFALEGQTYAGIGTGLGYSHEGVIINYLIEDAPAQRIGLQKNDIILKIDGEKIKDVEIAAKKIAGPAGTNVRLLIKRNNQIKEYDITREDIFLSDYTKNEISKESRYTSFEVITPIRVRTSNPMDSETLSRPLATLPVKTIVYIQSMDNFWAHIKWYSSTSKKYKYGYIPTIQVAYMTKEKNLDEILKIHTEYISSLNSLSEQMAYYIRKKQYSEAVNIANNIINYILVFTDSTNTKVEGSMKNMLTLAYVTRTNYYITVIEKYNSAINSIDEAIYYDNNTVPMLYYLKGLIYEEQGYYTKAKNCYIKEKNRSITSQNERNLITLNERIKHMDKMINLAK